MSDAGTARHVRGKDEPILVAGARGMVGSALVRRLRSGGYTRVLAPLRGWWHRVDLKRGLALAYRDFLTHTDSTAKPR